MSLEKVNLTLNIELNALGGITAILKYAIPELNDLEDDNVFQQDKDEEDDMNFEQFKKLDIHDDLMNFSDDDKNKNESKLVLKTTDSNEICQENISEVIVDEDEEVKENKESDEYSSLGGKKDKNFQNKSKRKSSKLEKKEREVHRAVNSRKKSEFDENYNF